MLPVLENHSMGCSRDSSPIRITEAHPTRTWDSSDSNLSLEMQYRVFVYFKKLAHVMMEAGKSRICKLGYEAGHLGKSQLQLKFNGLPAQFPLAQGKCFCCIWAFS